VDLAAATDALTARPRLLAGGISLVIAEIHLAGLDGIEFLRHVRATWPTSHIPVVILTHDWRVW